MRHKRINWRNIYYMLTYTIDELEFMKLGDIHTGEEYTIHKGLKATEWKITDSHIKMTEQSLAEDDREYQLKRRDQRL